MAANVNDCLNSSFGCAAGKNFLEQDILVVVLMWFVFYNGFRYFAEFCRRELLCNTGIARTFSTSCDFK